MGNQLQQELSVLTGAPFLSLAVLAATILVVWTVLHFLYRHRIEGLREELDLRQAEVDRLRAREPAPLPKPISPSPPLISSAKGPPKRQSGGKKKASLPPQPADRVFLGENVTVTFLMGQYHNVTKIQGDRIAAAYIGKWLRVSGVVRNVFPNRSGANVAILPPATKESLITMLIFKQGVEELEILHKGDVIEAIGRIARINSADITLDDCELIH